jgi:hypothetical protein
MRDRRRKRKKNYMKKFLVVGLISLIMVLIFGCESEQKNARLEVWLTDAPGDYQEVNVEIIGVEVHAESGETNSGWKELDVKGGVYDLLKLTNGLDTLLGVIELPPGKISQVRLKLGEGNTIKVGNEVTDLNVPSGQQSGLKLQVHSTLTEGITYRILLDFDVARSVVHRGNDTYSLKPVIRTITEAQDGAIRGRAIPVEATPAIYAIAGTDTVATTYADDSGNFLLRGLNSGSYSVVFLPNSAYDTLTRENVSVAIGNVTDIGEVTLVP